MFIFSDHKTPHWIKSVASKIFNVSFVCGVLLGAGFLYNIRYDEKETLKFKAGKKFRDLSNPVLSFTTPQSQVSRRQISVKLSVSFGLLRSDLPLSRCFGTWCFSSVTMCMSVKHDPNIVRLINICVPQKGYLDQDVPLRLFPVPDVLYRRFVFSEFGKLKNERQLWSKFIQPI